MRGERGIDCSRILVTIAARAQIRLFNSIRHNYQGRFFCLHQGGWFACGGLGTVGLGVGVGEGGRCAVGPGMCPLAGGAIGGLPRQDREKNL